MELVKSSVVFDEEQHKYWLGEKELHGITGMLSRQLFPDKYLAVPDDVLQRAAERGAKIHKACELVDELGVDHESAEAVNYKRICAANGLRYEASEYLVSDNDYFASAIDKVYRVGGDTFILGDIKTTYELDLEYLSWQLSIYAYLFERQNPGAKVVKLCGIWLRRQKSKLAEVERKDDKEIERLLACEKAGLQFTPSCSLPVKGGDELPSQYGEAEEAIIALETQIKALDAERKKLAEFLAEAMKEAGVKTWKSERLRLTIKDDTTRETFDSKAFKEEHPEMYGKYVKYSTVKGSLTIKITEQ